MVSSAYVGLVSQFVDIFLLIKLLLLLGENERRSGKRKKDV